MQRRRGFTLIELVVVTAIFGLMLTAAYQILMATRKAEVNIEKLTRSGKIGQALLSIIRRDLEGAIYHELGREVFRGEDNGDDENAEDTIDFLTTAPVPAPVDDSNDWYGEVASVGYILKRGSEEKGSTLFRRVQHEFVDDPLEGGVYTPIYDRVQALSFRFLDEESEWLEEWNSVDRIPEEVIEEEIDEDEPAEGEPIVPTEPVEEEPTRLPIPRAVEIILYIYIGDERGLMLNDEGKPILERYSTVVPLMTVIELPVEEPLADDEEDTR